ncbi:MAG: clostripain-related cysteine peptidase [Candidatus Babeliales bacterium]|nr:MAG: Clostripain family protease [candidate division TM6 bacterium GW2011_GWF2_36_6]
MRKILIIYLLPFLFLHQCVFAIAEWTMVVYMQGDNNLSPMLDRDMAEMASGLARVNIDPDHSVNILTQVDYPSDKKTWRFIITPTGKIEHGSLTSEMGVRPIDELITTGRWAKMECPAKKYAFVLWNHGSGVEDYRKISFDQDQPELKSTDKIDITKKTNNTELGKDAKDLRGILYDDSEQTCLTNQGLGEAFKQIMNILGQPIDVLAMDACLMSMVEIAYQVKNSVRVLVGSQQVVPGSGFFYTAITSELASNSQAIGSMELARLMVESYHDFYSRTTVKDYTLSAIDISLINALRNNIDQVATTLLECLQYKPISVRMALKSAREKSMHFENNSYIDLYSFYECLVTELTKLHAEADKATSGCCGLFKTSPNYEPALTRLGQLLNDGFVLIPKVVFANVTGEDSRNAHGISIYYPSSVLSVHSSYSNTLFAKESQWFKLIKKI